MFISSSYIYGLSFQKMTNPQLLQIGQVVYNKKPLAGLSENLKK